MTEVNKILVIRFSSIGDIILTTPVLRMLRKAFPEAQIDFVIKKQFSELLKHDPHITNLIEFDQTNGFSELKILKKKIRAEKYDLLIDLHRNLRSLFLKFSSGVLFKTVYHKHLLKRFFLVNFHLNFYKAVKPVYIRYFEAVRKAGINYDGGGTEITVPENYSIQIKEKLTEENLVDYQELVIICPGASFSNKRLTPECFIEIADQLAGKYQVKIAFAGGRQDAEICAYIGSMMKNKSFSFAGKLSLLQTASLLKQSSLVITNDSGLMHLAQAVKRPVVAIFGPTTRELGFFPLPENSRVVEKELYCRPCTSKGLNYCPKKHFRCMKDISANEITVAVESLNVL